MSYFHRLTLEGFVYSFQSQQKSASHAHNVLTNDIGFNDWTIEDVQCLYDKIQSGTYTISRDDKEKKGINGFIYGLHRQQFSAERAYQDISRVIGHDLVTDQYLQTMYTKIDYGEYDLKEIDRRLQLQNMPGLVQECIVKHLTDLKSRLILRKMTKMLRKEVDKGAYTIEELQISFDAKGVTIEDGMDINGAYEYTFSDLPDCNYCAIHGLYERSRRIIASISELAEKELRIVLESNKNLKIGTLWLSSNSDLGEMEHDQVFLNTLKALKKKPHVKTVRCARMLLRDMIDVLPYVDPNEIEELGMDYMTEEHCTDDFDDEQVKNAYSQIYELEQWKRLKSYIACHEAYCENVGLHFFHLHYADFLLVTLLVPEHIVQLKDNILQNNRDLEEITIFIDLDDLLLDEIEDQLRVNCSSETSKHPFKKLEESRHVLSVYVSSQYLWFQGPCFDNNTIGEIGEEGFQNGWFHYYY